MLYFVNISWLFELLLDILKLKNLTPVVNLYCITWRMYKWLSKQTDSLKICCTNLGKPSRSIVPKTVELIIQSCYGGYNVDFEYN